MAGRRGVIVNIANWPAADRTAWQRAIERAGLFDDVGPASHWSAGSRKSVSYGYGRWIGFLRDAAPQSLMLAPHVRVTPDRVLPYIGLLQGEVASGAVFDYVKHLYDAIRVMAPDDDWSWLKRAVWRLERQIVRRPKQHRVVLSHRLVALGLDLMDVADPVAERHPLQEPIRYRDGLIIALLALRPLRRRNIAMIRIGKHLQRVGFDYVLVFEPHETKTRRALEYRVPGRLTPYLVRYLAEVRPRFPGADRHDGLWASAKGCPMTDVAIAERVGLMTEERFGHAINLHLFRDCAATTMADRAPEKILEVGGLLGDSDPRTVERHYNQATMLDAACRYQGMLDEIVGDLARADDRSPKTRRS
jgi:integrase